MNIRHPALTSLLVTLTGAALAMIPGCNVVAPLHYAVYGPGKVEAVHTLDPEQSVVVFIDDPSSKIAQRRLRYEIADVASRTMLEKKTVLDVIDSRTVLSAASKERHGSRMSISELGQAVGADVVVYAVVTHFSVTAEHGTFLPTAAMRVKIIDVAKAQRTWPASNAGYLLEVRLPQRPSAAGQDGGALPVEQHLAGRTGVALAQLFYSHEITESASRGR